MLKLEDIVALAKQGYKPNDIKELIALSKEAEQEPQQEPKEEKPTPSKEPEKEPEQEPLKEPEKEPEEDPKIIEYKKKLEEMEKKLSDLQAANSHKDMSGKENTKSDSEVFAEAMRNFM